MTSAQFYKKLEACRDKFAWELKSDGSIRGEITKGGDGMNFCPITAMHYAETGEYVSTYFAPIVGSDTFNLYFDFINKVMSSADNEKDSVEYSKYTRNRLMRAVGLK